MTDELKQFEQYILSDSKTDFIQTMVFGTENFFFFSLIHALNTYGVELPKEYMDQYKQFKKFKSPRAENIKLRFSFMKLLNPNQTETKRKTILQEINKNTLHYNFDFDEPKTINNTTINVPQQEILDKLDPLLLEWKNKLEVAYDDISVFETLEDIALTYIDINKLAKTANYKTIKAFLTKANLAEFHNIEILIQKYLKLKNKNKEDDAIKFEELTLQQLKQLGSLNPDLYKEIHYVGELFIKEFNIELEENELSYEKKSEKIIKLLKIYEWSKKLPHKFNDLTVQLLYEILVIGIEINHYDFELFIEFLRNPKEKFAFCNSSHEKLIKLNKNKTDEKYWEKILNFDAKMSFKSNSLIEYYLIDYFKVNKKIEPFDEFLKSDYLIELLNKVRLYEGENISNINEIFNTVTLKKLQNERVITICHFNKDYFHNKDEVILYVELKNIPTLTLKIFEISTENYYLKKNQEINANINIDGFIANEEISYDFQEPPQKKVIKEFKFDQISKKKQGIFIIEFLGFGVSSRALIKKGNLTLIEKISLAGQQFTILDEDLEICKNTKRTGLWIKDRFHEADEHGQVHLPFNRIKEEVTAILVHKDFAYQTKIKLMEETYGFKCSYLYKDENILTGNKMKLLIQPRLYLNNKPANLDIIQDNIVTIITINESGISSTMIFDKLKFDYKKELEVQIPISTNLSKIKVEVKGKIKPMISDRNDIELLDTHMISMKNWKCFNSFCHSYLKLTNQGYEIYVLGRNGEPKNNVILNLEFKNKFLSSPINIQLQTNSEGKIILGDLKDIVHIKAIFREKGDIKLLNNEWHIINKSKTNYPEEINICEGDCLNLPYFGKELNKHKISFFSTCCEKERIVNNCISQLKLSKNKLEIEGLNKGSYLLRIKDTDETIKLVVHQGSYWKNSNLMITKENLIYKSNLVPTLLIEDIEIRSVDNKDEMSFSIYSDDPKTTRVHVFAYQFINQEINEFCNVLQNNIKDEEVTSIPIIKNTNEYLSNKILSDEYFYVLNRKKESRHLGNTLEKPTILLKRTCIKETTLENENLQTGKDWKEKREIRRRTIRMLKNSKSRSKSKSSHNLPQKDMNRFLNFLKYPCLILSNLTPDSDGKIVLKDINLNNFATIEIVAANLISVVHEIYPLEKKEIFTRDLRQCNSSKKFYSTFRNRSIFLSNEKFFSIDLASTEYQIIDSLEKIYNLQKEVIQSKFEDKLLKDYEDWKFLIRWNLMELEEKQKKYDEFASHELNIFIFFKDRVFFNNYIYFFLQNKIEKTFIDYFLLNDSSQLNEFLHIEKFISLNTLEKILLIIFLMQSKKFEQAKSILSYLENSNKLMTYSSTEYNELFDTILGSKSTESQQKSESDVDEEDDYENDNGPRTCLTAARRTAPPTGGGVQYHRTRGGRGKGGIHQSKSRSRSRNPSESDSSLSENVNEENNNKFLSTNYQEPKKPIKRHRRRNILSNDIEENYTEKRKAYIQEFKNLEQTKEYEERNYFNKNYDDTIITIKSNLFWIDLAKNLIEKSLDYPFLSTNFIYCVSSLTELISSLTFLSLSFQSENHNYQSIDGKGLEIQLKCNAIIFHKEIKEAISELKSEILITQRIYDPNDCYEVSEENPEIHKFKKCDEYIIDKIYESEIILTNVSISEQKFQILYEIPEGSIPVKSNDYIKSVSIQLDSFHSQNLKYSFYFPKSGKFGMSPASVSQEGLVVDIGQGVELDVHDERISKKLETIDQILAQGSKDDVLNFVSQKNILNKKIFKFQDIYYLLKDKQFYLKFIEILKNRKIFDENTWSFSIYHNDIASFKEFINSPEIIKIFKSKFRYFSNELLKVKNIKLLEYYPLTNSRTHKFVNEKKNILNKELKIQYKNFLEYFLEVSIPTPEDLLSLVYYLLVQDRIDEALKIFSKIDKNVIKESNKTINLQYDYFLGYLDFYTGSPDFKIARSICDKYLDYPILSWRNMFYEIANQLAEYDGEELIDDTRLMDENKLGQNPRNLKGAKTEEILNVELQNDEILILHQNCKWIDINYYLIDLEVLYSMNPFLIQVI